MNADPVTHAAQHFDAVDTYHQAMEREEQRLSQEFVGAVMSKTLTDQAGFGHVYIHLGDASRKTSASVFDVLDSALDGDFKARAIVFGALILCAKKGDVDAIAAVKKLADTYASSHAEVNV